MIPLTIKARVSSRASASAHLKRLGDAVIVERQGPRWSVLRCPCGCGAEVPINLDRRRPAQHGVSMNRLKARAFTRPCGATPIAKVISSNGATKYF